MAMNPRLLRPRATGFTPKSISGLAAWWDASVSSSFTLDGSGNVSTWADLSGNGVNATQATANNRPTPTAAGLNGKGVLSFDGSNDSLQFTGTARTNETMFVVARCNKSPGVSKSEQLLGDSASGFGLALTVKDDGSANSEIWAYLGGFSNGTTAIRHNVASGADIGPLVFTVTRSTTSGGQLFTNGTSRGTCTTSNSFTLSRIGVVGSTTFPLLGYIAEILIYSRAVSTTERQRIEKYLGAKWGLVVA